MIVICLLNKLMLTRDVVTSNIAVLGGDLCSVLGVFGVPMVVILHPLGNAAHMRCAILVAKIQ